MTEQAVITGFGAVTPLGVGAQTLFDRWAQGEAAIEGGEGMCNDFEPSEHLSRKEIRRADRFAQLALAASEEAVRQAGWAESLPYHAERIGCVIGTGAGGLQSFESELDVLRDRGYHAVSPLSIPRIMPNAAAAVVAMRYGLKGECYGITSACASGTQAIGAGMRLLRLGVVDAVVVGGAEGRHTVFSRAAFKLMGATSQSGCARPFDRRRDGYVPGEGAGVLVLERRSSAEARGAEVLGEVVGYGACSDAYHLTSPEPGGRGATQAIRSALQDANVGGEDIAYVNAHGTGTPLNDRTETIALKAALGPASMEVPVSSIKSAIGHLQGAAGAVEAIATLIALRSGIAPPTLGLEEPDEGLDLNYVPLVQQALLEPTAGTRIGVSNSFGFGGHNAVVVMKAP